eukprot:CAMPEP_0202892588 /NCGR_PEP_ID=MMETSP1392-20130828/2299_1 /ASSEMBLY_ACC=CAM_ASM_000868 /TAXON_ID=225041 /ORGANISM="Chlamydomonas chlamydogama, Strain SAG 11-48b" /LENGTH=324 /DNA_ID=CAMNT_0049576597 /DNA_START=198 /DNA_END=1172 /DNA_ORIENTATION=-
MSQLLKGLGLLGAGAYGYKQVEQTGLSDVLGGVSRVLGGLDGTSSSGRSASSSSTGELQSLQGEVDRLHRLLSDVVRGQRGQSHTIIHTGRSGSWTVIGYSVAGVGLVYVYCRFRGISIIDMFYVSRGSLTTFRNTVTEGFSKLWDELRKQKDEFVSRLSTVGKKQEQLIENQAKMDERLQQVGDSVDTVKSSTHQISSRVTMLDNKMGEVRDSIQHVQHGIYLLCSTVAEVTNRIGMHNSRNSQSLKTFVQGTPQAAALPAAAQQPGGFMGGLRTLIGFDSTPASGAAPSTSTISAVAALPSPTSVPTTGLALAGPAIIQDVQ